MFNSKQKSKKNYLKFPNSRKTKKNADTDKLSEEDSATQKEGDNNKLENQSQRKRYKISFNFKNKKTGKVHKRTMIFGNTH